MVPVLFTFFHLEQQGYQRLGSFYYRVSSVGMGFEAANNECEGAGARMLSMKNSQEHQFLRALNVTEQIVLIRKKEAPAELLRFFLRNVFLSALNVPEGGGECSGKDSACDGVLQWRDGDAFAFDNTFGIILIWRPMAGLHFAWESNWNKVRLTTTVVPTNISLFAFLKRRRNNGIRTFNYTCKCVLSIAMRVTQFAD